MDPISSAAPVILIGAVIDHPERPDAILAAQAVNVVLAAIACDRVPASQWEGRVMPADTVPVFPMQIFA